MKLVHLSSIFLIASACVLHAQTGRHSEAVGVSPYVQPSEAKYRLLFGEGANAGLGLQTPQTAIGVASYQIGASVLSAGFISSNPVSGGYPRITYTEFDLLYGLALDKILTNYARPSNQFHASISAGISIDDYSTRWRRFGRQQPIDPAYYLQPSNTTQLSLGLPLQLQAVYEKFRYVGMGVILFYNISNLQPSYGGAVILELRY